MLMALASKGFCFHSLIVVITIILKRTARDIATEIRSEDFYVKRNTTALVQLSPSIEIGNLLKLAHFEKAWSFFYNVLNNQ